MFRILFEVGRCKNLWLLMTFWNHKFTRGTQAGNVSWSIVYCSRNKKRLENLNLKSSPITSKQNFVVIANNICQFWKLEIVSIDFRKMNAEVVVAIVEWKQLCKCPIWYGVRAEQGWGLRCIELWFRVENVTKHVPNEQVVYKSSVYGRSLLEHNGSVLYSITLIPSKIHEEIKGATNVSWTIWFWYCWDYDVHHSRMLSNRWIKLNKKHLAYWCPT